MRLHLITLIAVAAIALGPLPTAQASWLFKRSYFSHAEETGRRVAQYAAAETPYFVPDASYMQSVYRQNRSSIRVGGSADHLHVVETWGEGETIRPYGEWQHPYRAGATPFGPWGNQRGPWTSPLGGGWTQYGYGSGPNYYYQGPFLGTPQPAPPPPVPGP